MCRRPAKFFLLPLAALLLGACGLLEAEPFIEPVREADINRILNNRATINLRHYSRSPAFTHFVIFYRIYVSNVDIPTTTTATFPTISSALAADFNAIAPFIDSDTMFGTNMHHLFSGRNFRYLTVRPSPSSASVNDVLLPEIGTGNIVEFDFTHSQGIPVIRVDTAEHYLWRATGHAGISFSPQPDRYFRNSDGLRARGNINLQFNADVADTPAAVAEITYVAMFIVAVGMDPNTFANIYSTPSLIHVFQLPPL